MIYLIGGARPNFMKIAAISRAFEKMRIKYEIIHTGQHYDYNMNEVFFNEFNLKEPYKHLGIGSAQHGAQTGRIMESLENLCISERPDMIFTVGDVNSTMAGALVGSKLHIPVAHQEAGMRSFDRRMPEEINRIVTDHISDLLFPISYYDQKNLENEGIKDGVYLVGDPMIDNLLYYTDGIEKFDDEKYILVELHRPANTDNKSNLTNIIIALSQLSEIVHVIFTIHPRTKKMIDEFSLWKYMDMIDYCDPVGYFDFIKYMKGASCVITDSDGIQQETSVLDVPCVAIRDTSNIEYTITYGTTELCNPEVDEIFEKTSYPLFNEYHKSKYPSKLKMLNDGKASDRIAEVIYEYFNSGISEKWNNFVKEVTSITPRSS